MGSYVAAQKNGKRSGFFFLSAIVFGIMSALSWSPIQDGTNDLAALSENRYTTLFSMVMLTLMAISTAMIAIPMFPVLKRYDESMALASVVFRLIESLFYLINIVVILGLLRLSTQYIDAGQPTDSHYDLLSQTLYHLNDATGHFASLFFNIGAGIYCYIFFKTKLIPRWIGSIGLVAVTFGLFDVSMLFLGVYGGDFNAISLLANLPTLLFELIIGFWLIVNGYNQEVFSNMEEAHIA